MQRIEQLCRYMLTASVMMAGRSMPLAARLPKVGVHAAVNPLPLQTRAAPPQVRDKLLPALHGICLQTTSSQVIG